AGAGPGCRRQPGLYLSPELRPAVSGTGRAGGDHVGLRPGRRQVAADCRRDHRDARRDRERVSALAEVVEAGGAEVPRLMERVEARMCELVRAHGTMLQRYAGDTI